MKQWLASTSALHTCSSVGPGCKTAGPFDLTATMSEGVKVLNVRQIIGFLYKQILNNYKHT